MSKVCDICGKTAQVGNHRSHALNATKRRFYPNLHKVRIEIENGTKFVKICSSCLKANKVRKAI
ncbi:MAG: 50S ribosomal protein L28 [Candidatus Cloacimonas sp.]